MNVGVHDGGLPRAGAFFDEANRFKPATMGEFLKIESHYCIGPEQRLYHYANGFYGSDGEHVARARIRELLQHRFRASYVQEVLGWLNAEMQSIVAEPPEDVICVRNGLLDWRTGELRDHSTEHKTTVQLPVNWNPDAHCPAIDRFLCDVLPDDAVEFLYELFGYALYPRNPFRAAILLLGPGGNGKSALLNLIKRLVGKRNCSAVPLQQLAESRFAAAELLGKSANICGDLDARAIKQTDFFKMLTGGDTILAERKFGQPFSFTSFALPIFSANEAPFTSDQTPAWFDRWVVVPMERCFPPESRVPMDQLLTRLTTQEELEGLLVIAVIALRRLLDRGFFDLPPSIQEAKARYRERLDTLQGFLAEDCTLEIDLWTPRKDLYVAYREWCTQQGRHPLAATSIYERLRQDFPGQVIEKTRRGVRGFSGVQLVGHNASHLEAPHHADR